MEPQGALVLPDEAGTYTVTSSTQNIDIVQKAVAEVLNIPMHKVTAGTCYSCTTTCSQGVPWVQSLDDMKVITFLVSVGLSMNFIPSAQRVLTSCQPPLQDNCSCS